MATHFHPLRVKDVRRETADCISVAFDIPPELANVFAFTQGQNITLKTSIDGQELRRSYSVCSSPHDDELRIAVKKVNEGKFSSWAFTQLQPGATIDILPPTGKFFTPLHTDHKKNYVAFAAGSGITPILSIIKTTLIAEPGSSFTLFYGNKNRASIIFKETLEALKNTFLNRFSIHHILSREKTDSPLNQGRLDAEKCASIFAHVMKLENCDEFFICGPQAMIFSIKDFLESKGVDKKKLHFELFTVPGKTNTAVNTSTQETQTSVPSTLSSITIQLDGIAFNFKLSYTGEAILDAALQQGADLPYACKGGVCATCRAKLISGQVSMDTNYALEPEEIANGFILTCQSHPRSEKVHIDFDQKS